MTSAAGQAADLAVGVGEILWDRLPGGDEIGGAPFNVVSHLVRLGHRAACLTAVGRDAPGDAALAELTRRGIDPALAVRAAAAPTGLARVTAGAGGSPEFTIGRPAAFEEWAAGPADRVIAMRPSLLIYGTLAQLRPAARDRLRQIVAGCPDALVLYDVNLRPGWWSPAVVADLIRLAGVVKLNRAEAAGLAGPLGVPWAGDAAVFARDLAGRHGLRGVAVTDGPGPAVLWLDGALARAAPPAAVAAAGTAAAGTAQVGPAQAGTGPADAVGAGDAFAAGLLDATGSGRAADAALRWANALGSLVAARRGAQPPWHPAELARLAAAADTGATASGGEVPGQEG